MYKEDTIPRNQINTQKSKLNSYFQLLNNYEYLKSSCKRIITCEIFSVNCIFTEFIFILYCLNPSL